MIQSSLWHDEPESIELKLTTAGQRRAIAKVAESPGGQGRSPSGGLGLNGSTAEAHTRLQPTSLQAYDSKNSLHMKTQSDTRLEPVCYMIMPFRRKKVDDPRPTGAPAEIDFDALWEKVYWPALEEL